MPKKRTVRDDNVLLWQEEATNLATVYKWLPFWRPVVIVKHGLFSPLWLPHLWFAKQGAYTSFIWVIISKSLLDVPQERRRAILAHECGHVCLFHDLIRVSILCLLLRTRLFKIPLNWISATWGLWSAGIALLLSIGILLFMCNKLLHWFEHKADDYAISKVGVAPVIETLIWLATLSKKAKPVWVNERISRLKQLHSSEK